MGRGAVEEVGRPPRLELVKFCVFQGVVLLRCDRVFVSTNVGGVVYFSCFQITSAVGVQSLQSQVVQYHRSCSYYTLLDSAKYEFDPSEVHTVTQGLMDANAFHNNSDSPGYRALDRHVGLLQALAEDGCLNICLGSRAGLVRGAPGGVA